MRTAREGLAGTKRYETFVIRVWVEEEGLVEHGEIRHIGSSSAVRFREIERAVAFIRNVIGVRNRQG